MPKTKTANRQSKQSDVTDKETPHTETRSSPYDTGQCPICLVSPQVNKSHPPCGHVFCYACLAEWCKVKLECPACKQKFTQFADNYDKVYVPPCPPSSPPSEEDDEQVLYATITLIGRDYRIDLTEELFYEGYVGPFDSDSDEDRSALDDFIRELVFEMNYDNIDDFEDERMTNPMYC